MPHWELIEAGPKCPACTPARELLEACRSGQKPPAYSPCSTFQTPCQKLDAYTPGGLCQLGKTCQAGPPKCPAYTPYLTVSLYCHNSNICVWEGSQADKHAGMERQSKLCSHCTALQCRHQAISSTSVAHLFPLPTRAVVQDDTHA